MVEIADFIADAPVPVEVIEEYRDRQLGEHSGDGDRAWDLVTWETGQLVAIQYRLQQVTGLG